MVSMDAAQCASLAILTRNGDKMVKASRALVLLSDELANG